MTPEGSSAVEQTRWRIDPSRSRIEFQVPHVYGLMTVKGRFGRYAGTLDLSATPAIVLDIEAASVNTKQPLRDRHLRAADFFDVKNHPQIRYVSESASLDGERLAIRGRLDAAGGSVPLELEATLRPAGDELDIEAVSQVDQRELGMSWNPLGLTRTPTTLIVKGRLVKDA